MVKFEVMVLYAILSRVISVNNKSLFAFVLATVYSPPGHHTDFIKEFADFLSEVYMVMSTSQGTYDFRSNRTKVRRDKIYK